MFAFCDQWNVHSVLYIGRTKHNVDYLHDSYSNEQKQFVLQKKTLLSVKNLFITY